MNEQRSVPDEGTPDRRRNQPETLRLRSLTPSFTVDDLERSVRFYAEGLGFAVDERWEQDGRLLGVILLAGTCRIGLSQDDWTKGRDRQKGLGFRLWAETAQDLDDLAGRMRERGIDPDGPKTEEWGDRTLSVVDPDGYTLTFTALQDQ